MKTKNFVLWIGSMVFLLLIHLFVMYSSEVTLAYDLRCINGELEYCEVGNG